ASVDFPQPDSPTMPSVSPRCTATETSSNARSGVPPRTRNSCRMSCISRTGGASGVSVDEVIVSMSVVFLRLFDEYAPRPVRRGRVVGAPGVGLALGYDPQLLRLRADVHRVCTAR